MHSTHVLDIRSYNEYYFISRIKSNLSASEIIRITSTPKTLWTDLKEQDILTIVIIGSIIGTPNFFPLHPVDGLLSSRLYPPTVLSIGPQSNIQRGYWNMSGNLFQLHFPSNFTLRLSHCNFWKSLNNLLLFNWQEIISIAFSTFFFSLRCTYFF